MRRSRFYRKVLALTTAIGLLSTLGMASASAVSHDDAGNRQEVSTPAYQPSGIEQVSDKVRDEFASQLRAVQEEIATYGQGEILKITRVDYAEDLSSRSTEGAPAIAPAALPGGCGLSVILYFTYRVVNSSQTSCSQNVSEISMSGYINKLDLFWGTWDAVAFTGNYQANASVLSVVPVYNCPTGNQSGFEAKTYGTVKVGSVNYSASAFDGTYQYKCG